MSRNRHKANAAVVLMLVLAAAMPATAGPADQPSIDFVRAGPDTVGLYEKFELRIGLDADFADPFNPDEIDVRAEFTSPSGKEWEICGFYNAFRWDGIWMAV